MRYMITFNHIDGVWDRLSEADREEHGRWLERFVEALWSEKQSKLVFLGFPEQRKTVRKQEDGSVDVLDGPAMAGPEQVGGYYIVEADSMEEAVEWARKGRWLVGSNEVRPILSAPS